MNTEHIDIGLARYSDWAFTSSVVVLVVALLLLAVELAYSRSRKVEPASWSPRARSAADSATPGVVVDAPRRPLDERDRPGRAGAGLRRHRRMLLVCIVLRGLATARVPWGNMYEFINLTCFCGLVAAAIVLRRPQYRALWVFVLLPVLILLAVSGKLALHQRRAGDARAAVLLAADPRVGGQPRLRGVPGRRAWPASCSWSRCRRWATPGARGHARRASSQRLPDAQTLDRIAYRTTIFAFPVFGFGVIFGAIWAEEAWGRYWGWDPKETVVVHRVGGLRRVPARPLDGGLARPQGRVDQRRRASSRWCSTCSSSTWSPIGSALVRRGGLSVDVCDRLAVG